MNENTNQSDAENFLASKESQFNPETEKPVEVKSLGKVEYWKRDKEDVSEEAKELVAKVGYLGMDISFLPTGGNFYPLESKLSFRPCDVKEIKHFSTINEDDPYDIDDKLNYIIDRVVRLAFPGKVATYKDLKRDDRFYMLFEIRESTFKNAENKLIVKSTCKKCKTKNDIELSNKVFSYKNIDDRLQNYYDYNARCFVIPFEGKNNNLYVPSIGVLGEVDKWVIELRKQGIAVDTDFLKIVPYLHEDWRTLNADKLKMLQIDYAGWSRDKFFIINAIVDMIDYGVEMNIKTHCQSAGCGEEVTAAMDFPDGIKSLFVISNIFGKLLEGKG